MVFNELGTGRFFWSQILDPGNLDALDFASAEARPDPLVGLKVSHGELILFGSTSVEWWVPTGNFLSSVSTPTRRRHRHRLLQWALHPHVQRHGGLAGRRPLGWLCRDDRQWV